MNYKDYSPETRKKMEAIETYLTRRFGSVQAEWELTLELLADNIEMYSQCKKQVKAEGVYDEKTGRKSPLLSAIKDLNATISKQTQKLGISPYDAAKIKATEEEDSQLLSNLMGLDD